MRCRFTASRQPPFSVSNGASRFGKDLRPADAYAAAGVDIDSANRALERIKRVSSQTLRPEVLAGVGPFSALFALGSYREPVLVSSTDGVGTKVLLARVLERYDTVGQDLVNHCVNDILTSGAEPLFFLDYLAGSTVDEEAKVAIVTGMALACKANGCALVGGETADMPGVYREGDFDIAGFIVGVVERSAVVDGSRIRPGHVLLALPSNGLHTNGYSLVRRLWDIETHDDAARARSVLDSRYPELGESLADALLRPHPSYLAALRPILHLLDGIAHITGGGLLENVPRTLPSDVAARFQTQTWTRPPIFDLIQRRGDIPLEQMFRTFNMGLGVVLATAPENVAQMQRLQPASLVVGEIIAREASTPAVILD
jgi:phosphoribosylformylglycinamidine cyclo-ligase